MKNLYKQSIWLNTIILITLTFIIPITYGYFYYDFSKDTWLVNHEPFRESLLPTIILVNLLYYIICFTSNVLIFVLGLNGKIKTKYYFNEYNLNDYYLKEVSRNSQSKEYMINYTRIIDEPYNTTDYWVYLPFMYLFSFKNSDDYNYSISFFISGSNIYVETLELLKKSDIFWDKSYRDLMRRYIKTKDKLTFICTESNFDPSTFKHLLDYELIQLTTGFNKIYVDEINKINSNSQINKFVTKIYR